MAMAKKKKHDEAGDEGLSFEGSLSELEKVVDSLESGNQGLSESLELYERGVVLLKGCQQMLEKVERRIEVLTGFDAEGNPVSRPLDEGDEAELEDLDKKKAARGKRRTNAPRPRKGTEEPSGDVDDGGSLF